MVLLDGSVAHVIAGGLAGTTGAVITSPLEIVKTRLQSSVNSWGGVAHSCVTFSDCQNLHHHQQPQQPHQRLTRALAGMQPNWMLQARVANCYSAQSAALQPSKLSILQCMRHIYQSEGVFALYKGLSMTILGVLPSRAIYFGAYFNGQELLAPTYAKGSHKNVVISAAFASFVSSTSTNPIWLIKTRLQLDQSPTSNSLTVLRCIREIWQESGLLGFYKGIQASYIGIAETSLHFVMYEHLKRSLIQWSRGSQSVHLGVCRADDVLFCSIASIISKSTATIACYPHEVLRTRLRQGGNKYTGLLQTLRLIVQEEGGRALYKGMMTHFVRQIPNTCIVLTTYEAILHLFRTNGMLA